jgi:ABC-type uncharacterized transport system substrate-binding protein
MRMISLVLVTGIFLFGSVNSMLAKQKSEQGTKEEARALAEKAADWFRKYGKEKTLEEITRAGREKKGEFRDRDLYIFAYDFHGVCLAQGDNPKLVGQNLFDWQDADGRYNIRGHIDLATRKGSGWSPVYKWTNPVTKKIEAKMTYIKKIDDTLWIGCGVYGKEARPLVEKRIGVLMSSEQARYYESLKGFRDRLGQEGYTKTAVTYIVENAEGSHIRAADQSSKFASAKLDLILTFGTLATTAAVKGIKDVPVVFSMVYDPQAAGITGNQARSAGNCTGASNRFPLSIAMQRLRELGGLKRLAVLYTPGEKNSESQLKELRSLQPTSGIKIVAVPLTRKEDVRQILPEVVHAADAIYLTGSSIVGDAVPLITSMANEAKVITITHLDDIAEKGALLGICANSYQVGRVAGKKAVMILKGSKPSSLPIEVQKKIDVILNMRSANAGRFQIPSDFMKKVTKTIE